MPVELRLLGEVEVLVGDRSIPLGHARQRCVLAGLAVDVGQPVPVGQLVERVWGGRTPGDARNVIYSYVARLRRALAGVTDVAIQNRAAGYTLVMPRLSVDLHRFRQLLGQARATYDAGTAATLFTQALGLWLGEPFSGIDNPWLDALRRELDLERLAADLEYADLRLHNGEHDRLLPELVARSARYPLDERVAGQLMLALQRTGRTADALRHYHDIRQRLRAELGTDPGPELQILHQRILAPDPAPAAAPVPRQLPTPPRLFTGRHQELARLSAGAAPITAIAGAGGIGKTWLALHWAHQHADRFPDGQLHVQLRGIDPVGQPVPPGTALRRFLEALGVTPTATPAGLEERATLFRSLVAGRRMLIVADNARDADQVIPLLPGSPTCTVLITSRYRLTGLATTHAAHLLDLDVLPEPEAREVLARHVPAEWLAAEPAAVTEMLAVCAGLPLALGITAARAAQHPNFPLALLAKELRDMPARLDSLDGGSPHSNLRAVLSWSYRALADGSATAFTLLALAPGPDIGAPAVAALIGLPPEQARKVLRELETASLVQQHVPGRYRMHDLTRLYATEQAALLPVESRTAALRRVADHFLHGAQAADRALHPHGGESADIPSALAWLATEHPCLLAAQQLAVTHGWHAVVWRFAAALNSFHIRQARHRDNVMCWQAGLTAANQLADPAAQQQTREGLGRAYARADRYAEALELMGEALTLAEQAGDLAMRATVHDGLSLVGELTGDPRLALSHAVRALRLHRTLGDAAKEASELAVVGWHLACLGRHTMAQAICAQAITQARRLGDDNVEAAALDTLGHIAQDAGRHTAALDHYGRALAIFRVHGRVRVQAEIQSILGDIHADLDQWEAAHAAWQQAVDLYETQHRTADAERVRQTMITRELARP
jgi:DNA-binding SARP family transcriptional activator/tetratricopeptide (TPR) repeat protein